VLAIVLHVFVFTHDTADFSISIGDKEEALKQIAAIFSKENALTHEAIYQEKLQQFQEK